MHKHVTRVPLHQQEDAVIPAALNASPRVASAQRVLEAVRASMDSAP